MNSDQSNLEQLILNNNPFDRSLVVRSHDIWEQHFPDVPSINATVSDAILQGISQVKQGQRDVLGIAIKAEKGLGKSHLLSRVRSQVKSNGDSFFIYANESDYDELDDINQRFLNTVALSMKQIGNHDVTQWQELAAL
jgi:KAP family P-loop domain